MDDSNRAPLTPLSKQSGILFSSCPSHPSLPARPASPLLPSPLLFPVCSRWLPTLSRNRRAVTRPGREPSRCTCRRAISPPPFVVVVSLVPGLTPTHSRPPPRLRPTPHPPLPWSSALPLAPLSRSLASVSFSLTSSSRPPFCFVGPRPLFRSFARDDGRFRRSGRRPPRAPGPPQPARTLTSTRYLLLFFLLFFSSSFFPPV